MTNDLEAAEAQIIQRAEEIAQEEGLVISETHRRLIGEDPDMNLTIWLHIEGREDDERITIVVPRQDVSFYLTDQTVQQRVDDAFRAQLRAQLANLNERLNP